jgi:hypothetical protein
MQDVLIDLKGKETTNSRGKKNRAITTEIKGESKRPKRIPFSDRPMLEQKTMPYSIVEDLMHVKSNISIAQLLNIPKIRNDLKKAITPKRKRKPKDKEKDIEVQLATTYNNTPMICKGQVGGWTVDIILDSGSSTSIISKKFLDHLERKAN